MLGRNWDLQGDNGYNQFPFFEQILSIELSKELYDLNVKKFKGFQNISLFFGNSGEVLKEIVPKLSSPTLFWLDAHFSEGITAGENQEVPIFNELETISRAKVNFSILIDDIASFTGTDGYPTIEKLEEEANKLFKGYTMFTKNNIFFILPS